MKKLRVFLLAFLVAGALAWAWCQAAWAAGTPTTTVSSLMKVLKEDKQKAVYNINLNAPFNKETCGVRESVSTETGEVIVDNTVFEIPGRNGMDLDLVLQYRSRDAKTKNEGTKNDGATAASGEYLVAVYDIFDSSGYWVGSGTINYTVGETIFNNYPYNNQQWVFTGYLQSVNGTSLSNSGSIANTTIQKSRETAAKYIFGEGWSLDIPSVEVDGETVYVHLPNGQSYKADFSTAAGLADYELTDLVFTLDTTYGNGKDLSKYRLYYANGDAYYFSDKGELLVEMDRFRNAIRYYWEDLNGLRALTRVVDSVGRAVDIQYNETATIFKSGGRSVRLVKTPIPGETGKYCLSSFIDAQGREFRYKYTFQEAAFDQAGKPPANNLYANLIEISYPTGAKTQYVWQKGTKNIGASGYMEYFKVKERQDVDGGRTYNRLAYQWFNEPDGYPAYKATNIDELYKYYSTVTDSRGLTTRYLYNAKHLMYNRQQYSTRLLNETFTQYHPAYKLPARVTTKTYNTAGEAFEKLDTYDYDHRGNVITENHPAKPEEENSGERKAFYSYDFEYNLLTGKKYKQDKDTTIEIKYTLSADKKTVAAQSVFGGGRLVAQTEYTYDGYGNVTGEKIEKEPGEWVTTRFEYAPEYQGAYLTAVISEDIRDADGGTRDIKTSSTYDFATGNQTTATDGNGHTTAYEYDALDRPTGETYPDGSFETLKYDDLQNILEVTDANGHKLVYDYDGLGNLVQVTEPDQNTVLAEMEYDENEILIAEKDGNKNLKQLAYDELTRLTGVTHTDPAGRVLAETGVSYDEAFHDRFQTLFKVTATRKGDRRDRPANYYFDTYERMVKLGRLNGGREELARYKYDYLGNQTEATDFAGQKSLAEYDALGRLVKATDPEGHSTEYRYDRLGNLTAQTDALGRTVYFEYDKLGRRTVVKAPFENGRFSISKYYYDNNGNLVKVIDPDGYITKQYFNNRDFLYGIERVINDQKSNITKFEHDKEGNTTKVVKGLNSWTDTDFSAYIYKYNNLNQLVTMLDASNRETRYEYDDNGNLVKLIDRNKTETTFTYDGLDRLINKKNSKDGKKNAVSITIDKLGQIKQMADASGTTVFDYDDLGRLKGINYGNGIKQIYDYDKADRVSNLQVRQGSLGHINLNYGYDKVGRLTAVRDNGKRFGYKYNAIGQLIEELNGVTGIKSTYQYYPSGNVKNLRHWNGKDLVSGYEYKYDARGNQTEKDEGTGTTKYYYDALSRIKTAVEPDKTQNYEYDDLDNIKELTEIKGNKIEETKYVYDKDSRLLLQETNKGSETEEHRFTYDANGNQLTKDEVVKRNNSTVASKNWNYWYDGFNQLQRVKNPEGKFIEYTYNGQGLRTKKDFGDKSINYYYNGGNIILETDQTNTVTARNIRGLRLIYRENNPGQTDAQFLYYLHNAHGDVTQLLNEKGQVIKDYRYDPFGQEEFAESLVFGGKQTTELWRKEIEKIDNPFRYCGEYLDEETGNYYLRARYYDPSVQRFINEDSYAVAYGAAWKEHLYSYANNDPINCFDPTGHLSWGRFWGGVKSVGSTIVSGTKAAGNAVVSGAKAAGNAVVSGAKTAGKAVVSGVKAAGNAVVSGVKSVVTSGKQIVGSAVNKGKQVVSNIGGKDKQAVNNAANKGKQGEKNNNTIAQGTGQTKNIQGNITSNANQKSKIQQTVEIAKIVANIVIDNRKTIAKYAFDGKSYTVSGSALFDLGLVFDDEGIRPMYGGGAAIPGFSVMESKGNAKTGWYLNFVGGQKNVGGQISLDEKSQVTYSGGILTGKALGVTVDYVGDPFFKW